MPNAAAKAAKRSTRTATATPETIGETEMTSTETATAPTYDIGSIGDLGSFEFKRSGAGRKRVPSPFDDAVESFVGQGTKFLPVADKDAAKQAVEDLQKACNWDRGRKDFKGYGLTKRVLEITQEGEQLPVGTYVVFEVKPEKETRVRKPKTAPADQAAPSVEAQELAETE